MPDALRRLLRKVTKVTKATKVSKVTKVTKVTRHIRRLQKYFNLSVGQEVEFQNVRFAAGFGLFFDENFNVHQNVRFAVALNTFWAIYVFLSENHARHLQKTCS